MQVFVYVRRSKSKQQELFTERESESKNWLDFQLTRDTIRYNMIHVTTLHLIPHNDSEHPSSILGLN